MTSPRDVTTATYGKRYSWKWFRDRQVVTQAYNAASDAEVELLIAQVLAQSSPYLYKLRGLPGLL